VITFEGISKRYGRTAVLERASFEARPGEVTLLTGPNGAGKSTSLKIIAGLVRPDEGSVRLGDVDLLSRRTAALAHLSYLPQTVSFHPALTPRQILEFYARLRGARNVKVEGLIETVGLADRIDAPMKELSGGMVQRVGIAVLLLPDAPILLLDEPGISLDPEWRVWLQQVLRAEADRGKTVLLTTHYVGEWQQADRELLCKNATIGGATEEMRKTVPQANRASDSGFGDIVKAVANAI
jgi:ABC-2 type transport system ATP-binding protein